jgi:alkanesulfonate monooxygenase SsuD/methylene tetrahydromethanopterin reductase-like flavin-dependent oxidoreductase (luciferase family)
VAAFRFALQVSKAESAQAWRSLARRAEDLGYSTLYVPDHLDDQWSPMVACAVAAEATTTLRVGTLVLDNDFRYPVVLAKEAATLDVLTEGRFEFGIGAGWMTTDYEQSGIPMEAPSVRIGRLEESLEIMRAMWRDGSATFHGKHYDVQGAVGSPPPVTPGGPPIVIGLEVAAESVVEKYRERVQWARDAAGERAGDLELQCWTVAVQVVPNADEVFESMAPLFGLSPDQMRAAPLALIGTVPEIIETLRRRREELGFSYIVVHEAEYEALAPVVAELAGT